jgi:AraC-like DNA-binding protein
MGTAFAIAHGADFPDLARQLFGAVRLDFPERPGESRHLTSAVLGDCRISELEAGAHTVHGERVVRSSNDPDALKLLIQTEGRSAISQGGRTVDFGDGMPVVYDPTRPYVLVNSTRVRLMMLQVPRDAFSGAARDGLASPFLPPAAFSGFCHVLFSTMQATLREAGRLDEASRASLGRTLADMVRPLIEPDITDGFSKSKSLETLLARAKDYIEAHLEEPDLSVERVATRMGCSPRYIFRAFEADGTTPSQFIWNARLVRARANLGSTTCAGRTISEIAFSLGFSSSAHFSRAFRDRFGMSPRDFRHRI